MSELQFRVATISDLPTIIHMLADDTLGKTRKDAVRFYESLGFTASHDGMKLSI